MKKLFISLLFSIVCFHLSAQNISNPFASIGKKAPKVATVTNGQYEEFFTKDSLVQIGTTVMNRYTGEVAFFEEDNLEKFKQFTEHSEKNFRFLSVDPLSKEYPWYTPYQFAANSPIDGIDLDGEEWIHYKVNYHNKDGQCLISKTGEVDYGNWILNLYSKMAGDQPEILPTYVVEAPDGLHYLFQTEEGAYTATISDFDPHTRYTLEGVQSLFTITDAAGGVLVGITASSNKPTETPKIQQLGANKRPTWQQSEKDIVTSDYEPQASFKNGKKVNSNTKGSVKPDGFKPEDALEVKNYDVGTSKGRDRLVNDLTKQLIKRQTHLPKGTAQTVVIDLRGQKVAARTMQEITNNIKTRTRTPNVSVTFKIK